MTSKEKIDKKLSERLGDPNAVLEFLRGNGFSVARGANLDSLANAVLHYCRLWENSIVYFNLSTTHRYPLQQQLLLAENQKEPIQYYVKSSTEPEKFIGKFELDRKAKAISSHFFPKLVSQRDDHEFSQFLQFLRHVECHIENDCQEFEKVSLLTVLRNPSKYPLSKVPFVIEHLKKALVNYAAIMLMTASFIWIFNLATNVARTSSYHIMNEQEIIPFEAIIYYTIVYFLLLMQLSISAAILGHEIKAVNKVLSPSETSRSDYGRESLPSLKGLIVNSLWSTVPSDLAGNNVQHSLAK